MRGGRMINYPKFGDIFIYSSRLYGDSEKSGFQPVAVIRANEPNENSGSIVVAPITSKYKQSCQINHVVLGKRFGLKKSSVILLEQMKWVNPEHFERYVGHITEAHILRRINQGIKRAIELQNNPQSNVKPAPKVRKNKTRKNFVYSNRDVMCLCPVCRDSYRHRGFKVVNVHGIKGLCDLCNYRQGFDYAVVGLLTRRKT